MHALAGIGPVTAQVIDEALTGAKPEYLQRLETDTPPIADEALALLRALRGDCHVHSDWSDGGSPIHEMAAVFDGKRVTVRTAAQPRKNAPPRPRGKAKKRAPRRPA